MSTTNDNLDELLDAWQAPPLGRDLTGAIIARAQAEDRAMDDLLARSAEPVSLGRDLTDTIVVRAKAEDRAMDDLLARSAAPVSLGRDLTDAIVARAKAEDQAMDELLARSAAPVSLGRDLTGAILAKAQAEENAFDRLLDRADQVPAMTADIGGSVLRTIRRGRMIRRVVAMAGGLAAAAAVLIVVLIGGRTPPANPGNSPTAANSAKTQVEPAVKVADKAVAAYDDSAAAKLFTAEERLALKKAGVAPSADELAILLHWDTIRAMEQLEEGPPDDSGLEEL